MRSAVEKCLAIARREIGARLEAGAGPAWPRPTPSVRRRVALPEASVIGVGGVLVGGSGRTPLALAIVEWLAQRSVPVAFVGHGYGARVRQPLRVRAWHGPRDVGDEAIVAYRRLAPLGVPVWVGPRQTTLAAAGLLSNVLVVDGLLQTVPRPLALAVLALSAPAPWGSGKLFPRGDLRAPARQLVAAADQVVVLAESETSTVQDAPDAAMALTTMRLPPAVVDASRWGLLLGVARPARIVEALERRGHRFAAVLRAADHGADAWAAEAARLVRERRLEGFVVTAKCDAALSSSTLPRALLTLEVALPQRLQEKLRQLIPPSVPLIAPPSYPHTSHLVAPCLAEREPARVSP